MICLRCAMAVLTQAESRQSEASFTSVEGCPSCYTSAAVEQLVPAAVSTLSRSSVG